MPANKNALIRYKTINFCDDGGTRTRDLKFRRLLF